MSKTSKFGSKFGTIAALGGSVVGLGNIWRFPYITGQHGGGAFIIIYLLLSFSVAVPLLISEITIGRGANTNPCKAFNFYSKIRAWEGIGYLSIITAFSILAFYSIIAGWALHYLIVSITQGFGDVSSAQITENFVSFTQNPYLSYLYTLVFIGLTALVIRAGVEKGIEKYCKIFMPTLFIMIILLVFNSMTLDKAKEGFLFVFNPDFSKITLQSFLDAIGQSFFSLSLGMCCMVTYGAYVSKETNIVKTGATIAITDVTVAILSTLVIFPAAFTFGIQPGQGPELVFITLPSIFGQMPGGYFFSIFFFVLLFIAAITSSISMFEIVTSYTIDKFNLTRNKAVVFITLTVCILSALCVLSQLEGSIIKIGGKSMFDFLDGATSNFLMPVTGLLTALFAGWVIKKAQFKSEATNNNTINNKIFNVVYMLIKYFLPIVISIIFLTATGLIKL